MTTDSSGAKTTPPRKRGRPRQDGPSEAYVARRQDILAMAATVFREKGYDAGSLDDVAEALDLRKASLYYYVKSKSELLYFIFDAALSDGLSRLDALSHLSDPAERLSAYVEHQVALLASDTGMFKVFFDNRPLLSPEFEELIRAKEHRYFEFYIAAVSGAVEAGLLPPIDPRYGAQAVLGMCTWTYKWFTPGTHDCQAVAADFIALLLGPKPRGLTMVPKARHEKASQKIRA